LTNISENKPIKERFEHLLNVLSSNRFLKMEGLGNEVPFFICPFKPEEAVDMSRVQRQLKNRLHQQGIRVIDINLYDLTIELLKERQIWDQIITEEATYEKAELFELLQGVLDSETHVVPAIAAKLNTEEYEMLFLTGVGEVFPYIRSHNILNNLQSTAKDKPTVMFFPGGYNHSLEAGASLNLFGRLQDDKYYRAFNIYHYEV